VGGPEAQSSGDKSLTGRAMQQIADWLKKLGMPEYAERFAENKIDVSVLRHLTDQDLKDIGVPLGHRRKMLAAIGELGGATPARTEPVAGAQPKTQDTAERRQVCSKLFDIFIYILRCARIICDKIRLVPGSRRLPGRLSEFKVRARERKRL
jgi:uncharacterized protein YjiS (DUF1127 family)